MSVLSRVRSKLAEFTTAMDGFSTRLAHGAPTLFAWPLAYACAIGTGAFAIRHLSWIALLDGNKVATPETYKMAIWIGVAAVALAVVYAVAYVVARIRGARRGHHPTGPTVMAEVNRRLRPVLALPLLPALTLAAIERDSPKETLFLIVLVALVAGASAYAWLRPTPSLSAEHGGLEGDAPPPRRPLREGMSKLAAGVAVLALWAGYAVFFSWFSITNHHGLRTSTIDLGLYDNIFYQSAHGHPLGCSFIKAGYHGSAHFDPILVLIAPLYRLYPRAEFLLALQSAWLGAGVVPAYLVARNRLESRLSGVAFAAMFAVYPAVHGANMYDFHSLTLVTPIALFAIYFLQTGRRKSYWALLLPMLLVREDIAILLCFVGAYAVLSRRPGMARVGWITILLSMTYFALVKRVFMTSVDVFNSGTNSYSFAYYYEDLIPNHNGAGGLLLSLFTNPVFVMKMVLSEAKILYLLTLFVPLAFLPFVARPHRIMLGWGLFFCLLASRAAVFSTHFQYSCIIIPVAFAIAPEALRQIEDGPFVRNHGLDGLRFRRAIVFGAFVASLLCSWKFGGILNNASFAGGFTPPARALTDHEQATYAWIRTNVDRIPLEDSVGLTNRTGAHAANREKAYYYTEHPEVDWAFVDETELHGAELDRHNKALQAGVIELVSKHDRFAFYKRKKKP